MQDLAAQAADRDAEAVLLPSPEADLPAGEGLVLGPDAADDGTFAARVLVQIARAGSAGAHRGVERLRVRLYPPALGRVDVVLSMQDGRLSASIRVESEQVRQLVESNMGALRESLASAGIDVGAFDVASSDRRFETMPLGGRRFRRGAFSLQEAEEAETHELAIRIAWPWSAIDTVA